MDEVERVARAITKAEGADPDRMESDLVPNPRGHGKVFAEIKAWKKRLPLAEAAIAALREPDLPVVKMGEKNG